jgi:tetratricopeptide (TPR) repeat protein
VAYREGRRAFLAERYGAAIKAWKPIAGAAGMRPWLAEAYLRRGLQQGSTTDFEQAIQLQPDDDRALRALAGLLLRQSDVAGARRAVARYGDGGSHLAEVIAACQGLPPKGRRDGQLSLLSKLSAGEDLPAPARWPADLRPLAAAVAALIEGGRPEGVKRPRGPQVSTLTALFASAAALQAGEDPRPPVAGLAASGVPELGALERSVARRAAADLLARADPALAESLMRRFPAAFDDGEKAALSVRAGALHFAAGRFPEAAAAFRSAAGTYEMGQPIALAFEADGDEVQATREWVRVLSREERRLDVGARADLAKIHLHVARLAWRADDFRSAVAHFERGLRPGEPDDPRVLYQHADCLDSLGQRDTAVRVYLRYLLRVPGDRETILWLIDDRMWEEEYESVLDVVEALPEWEEGAVSSICHEALTVIAMHSLMSDDDDERLRRVHAVLPRIPGAADIGHRVAAIVAARDGRLPAAVALLEEAPPIPEDEDISELVRLVDGTARLRVGRLREAMDAFDRVLEGNILRIAVMHCLMHAERTGARSCAASPEGEVMEQLLARAGRQNPGLLFAKVPRRAQGCSHFRQALGRARTQPEVMAAIDEMAEGGSVPALERLVAGGFGGER